MSATRERRRPAVSPHPLAAVPAATVARLFPAHTLLVGRDVVHVKPQSGDRAVVCATRLRVASVWTGTPLRMCALCASALGVLAPVFGFRPTRAELGDMHLHAAEQIVAAVRERLADIRSAAIYDGSALIPAEQLPTYRTSRGVPESQPVPPLRTAVILGQVLERIAPDVVVVSAADEAAHLARDEQAAAERQRFTDRTTVSSQGRRQDLRSAHQGRKATQ